MDVQVPLVCAGSVIEVSGYPATVVRIEHGGVVCHVGARVDREYELPFEAIEVAIDSAKSEGWLLGASAE